MFFAQKEDSSCLIKAPRRADIWQQNKTQLSACFAIHVNNFSRTDVLSCWILKPIAIYIPQLERAGSVK
jgi:hypothetical protein